MSPAEALAAVTRERDQWRDKAELARIAATKNRERAEEAELQVERWRPWFAERESLEAENVRLRAERETLAGLAAAWLKGWECDAYDDLPERTRAALSPRLTREKSDAFLRWFEENVEPAFPRQETEDGGWRAGAERLRTQEDG